MFCWRSLTPHTFTTAPRTSIRNEEVVHLDAVASKRLTDIYLLAVAAQNHGELATFDTRIPANAVTGGIEALFVIPRRQ